MNAPLRYQLPNGLTVVLQQNHASKVVAFQAWVGVGSADEPPELAGIAHVFEHMLFKGTARRGVGQIAQEVEAAGGEINAWTSFDQTVYHLVLASRFFDTGLDILADALLNSSFDPVELERELKVVLEEVKQGEDNPSRVATQALFGTAYTRHPYRRPVIGYTKTVKAFTRERLLDFFKRYYVANNFTMVVVGDFDLDKAKQKIAEAFSKASSRPIAKNDDARKEPQQKSPRSKVVTQEVREAHLTVAFHIPGIHHVDTGTLDVASIILGQGDSSRLTVAVKRQAQIVTDVYAYSYTPRDPGLLVAGATLPPEKLDGALDAILEQVFRLCHEEVTEAELQKAQAIIESDAVYQKETVQGQARKLGFFETVAGGLDYEEEYARQVRAVTPKKLLATVQRYLAVENATVTVLIPDAPAARVKALEAQLQKRLVAGREAARLRFAPDVPVAAQKLKAAAPADGVGELIRVKLPSGARLLVQRDPTVGLVAMRAVWMGGLRYEDEKNNGINNLIAALATRGTRTRSGDEIAREVEGMAGAIGGFSGRNSFGMRTELLSRHWERGLEIFADCILNPAFAEPELDKERRQVLEEIRTQEDNVSAEAFRLFSQALYKKHPYRLDLMGSAQSVGGMTKKKLHDYYKRHVAPEQMTLAVVGDVQPAEVIKKARALFGVGEKRGALVPEPPPRDAPPAEPLEVFRFQNKQQAHVVYGFPGTTLHDADRFPLEVLSTILSGQGGRLFVELRDKKGLAYRVSAFSVEGVDPGYFAVYIACSPGNLDVAIAGIKEELGKIVEEPVPKAELERSKRYLVGAHEISLQRRAALASTLAFHECYGLGWDEYRRYASSVLKVTAADVQRVAQRYLDPARSILATVKPEESASAAAKPKAGAKAARANGTKSRRGR
ncbi:MAG TPA: pitrilysin family protein [Kofleriaceae bacterium]|nr:pitrilysin family protein [Kofleriaceae bacterium]